MNYQKIYDSIIDRAKNRCKLNRDEDNFMYYESHHIIPRCIGGTNERSNLVLLTAEEHWVAHLLLVKIYNYHPSLIYACQAMSIVGGNTIRTTNRMFGWIRKLYANEVSKRQKGRVVSLEQRKKISDALSGRPNPNIVGDKNPMKDPIIKAKALAKRKGKKLQPRSEETKRKISIANKGHKGLDKDVNPVYTRVCCIICNKETNLPSLSRWHNHNTGD